MIETYSDMARVIMEPFKRYLASPAGIISWAALTGIVGVVILTLFFTMLLPPASLAKLLPLFVAFNGAASAYDIGLKGGNNFPNVTSALVIISILLGGTEASLAAILLQGNSSLVLFHFFIGGGAALLFSFLGYKLVMKSQKTYEIT